MTLTPPPDKPEESTPTPPAPITTQDDKIYALVVDDERANRDFMMRLLQQTKIEVRGHGVGNKQWM
jgi:hypothetical protein